jgi:hypothetical protein
LADGRDGFQVRRRVGGEVEGFDLFVEGGFAGVVEAEEEDGVFCWVRGFVSWEDSIGGNGEC